MPNSHLRRAARRIQSCAPAWARCQGRVRRVLNHPWTMTTVTPLVSVVFICHFSMVGLYLLPLNPLKLAYNTQVMGYINPLFTQNWHLFAPNPVDTSMSLVGKCRGAGVDTPWFDVTYGITERLGPRAFASSLSSVLHLQLSLARQYLFGFVELEPLLQELCLDQPTVDYCRMQRASTDAVREEAKQALVRLVTDLCVDSDLRAVDSVYVRIVDLEFPRFSERHLPDTAGTAHYVDIEWQSIPNGQ